MLTKKIAAGLTAFVITASAALLPLPESINGILGNTAISAQAYSAKTDYTIILWKTTRS